MTSNGEKVGTLRYAQRTDYYNNDGYREYSVCSLFYDLLNVREPYINAETVWKVPIMK